MSFAGHAFATTAFCADDGIIGSFPIFPFNGRVLAFVMCLNTELDFPASINYETDIDLLLNFENDFDLSVNKQTDFEIGITKSLGYQLIR